MKSANRLNWLLLFLCITTGTTMFSQGYTRGYQKGQQTISPFAGFYQEVESALRENYVDPSKLDPQKMAYGAISGMVRAVGDQHMYFLSPEQAAQLAKKRAEAKSYAGIGISVQMNNGALTVISVTENGPAEKAGIIPGDAIVKADGHDVSSMTIEEAVLKIRGPMGTSVVLTVWRAGNTGPFDISVARDRIHSTLFKFRMLGGKIAYVRLSEFDSGTSAMFVPIATKILDDKASGIILDLRNNPGGFLEETRRLAGWFVTPNSVLTTLKGNGSDTYVMYASNNAMLEDIPLVILVNEYSASASEVLAGALRYHRRTPIIGNRTYGKGSAQIDKKFSNGAILHVTVDNWLTPDGTSISEKGIEPDINISSGAGVPRLSKFQTGKPGMDPQLDKAIEILKNDKP